MRDSVIVGRIVDLLDNAPAFARLPEEVRHGLLGEARPRYYNTQQSMLKVVFSTVQETQDAVARRYGFSPKF